VEEESVKLAINAGSGQRPFTSNQQVKWLNWDCQSVVLEGVTYTPDLICDLREKWQAEDDSVDYVVLSHSLEHEGCGEAQHYQQEAYRVLRASGSLIVTVPDMRQLAQAWLMGKIDTQLYLTNVYGAYRSDEHDRHRWGFDHDSLHKELRKCFSTVCDFDWRPIPGMDLARDWWILGAEAIK
jgi:predicted SAM-dependent methyltransferase